MKFTFKRLIEFYSLEMFCRVFLDEIRRLRMHINNKHLVRTMNHSLFLRPRRQMRTAIFVEFYFRCKRVIWHLQDVH